MTRPPGTEDAFPGAAAERITLSLVSHTNVGKTTLARTLLRRDVGEVLDQAHVTEEAERFVLVTAGYEPAVLHEVVLDERAQDDTTRDDPAPDDPASSDAERSPRQAELVLWDTPGFGDSARLLRRLRTEESPVLWFLQQTWDRLVDRPFWSSQRATLNVRQEADVVLYLVNAAEEPEDAGYVDLELELLDWLGVPVLLLLNQTGELGERPELLREARERWRRHCERFGVVHGVLPLDAFSRAWVQESRLLEEVEALLPEARRPAMAALRAAWDARNLEVFERAVDAMADYLVRSGRDRETLPSKRPSTEEKQRAMEELVRRLGRSTQELMTTLLAVHQLEGEAAAAIDRQLDAFAVEGEDRLDPERGALLGGIVSGAVGGLAADLLSGGLTFGGGMLAGAILGALGGAGLARGVQLVRGDRLPEVGWTAPFLDRLFEQTLLRYLAVAHFGRGRGEFRGDDTSERWRDLLVSTLRPGREQRLELWRDLVDPRRYADRELLHTTVDRAARRLLATAYPDSATLLGIPPSSDTHAMVD
ncbi:MAG: DUF3482 domain-containing protein [Acidobacteriota bacterium]